MKRKNTIRKLFLLFFLMALIIRTYGQKTNSSLTKEQIINNTWEAMFDKIKNEDIKTIYVEGTSNESQSRVLDKTMIKRPNLFRNEVEDGVLVFDGKRAAWSQRNPDENGVPRKPEMIDSTYWAHFEVDIAILFPAFFDYPSELKGVATTEGVNIYEIYVELPLGANITYLIDAENFLIIKRLVNWEGKPNDYIYDHEIIGYRDYDGILYQSAYTYPRRVGRMTKIYKNVKFNMDLEDESFKIPSSLK